MNQTEIKEKLNSAESDVEIPDLCSKPQKSDKQPQMIKRRDKRLIFNQLKTYFCDR